MVMQLTVTQQGDFYNPALGRAASQRGTLQSGLRALPGSSYPTGVATGAGYRCSGIFSWP